MLIDDHPRSTRMRTETPDVDPDENETFRDALAEFKRALDQNLPIEDHQAHYDLGIAFKEMGLLDEAISEFQKALRAPEVRLRTSEALGEVFFDQGRPAVAEAVLRGVENGAEGDAEKIGVLYWLGRALDAQGKHAEARRATTSGSSRSTSRFRDAGERLSQAERRRAGMTLPAGRLALARAICRRRSSRGSARSRAEMRRMIEADFPLISDVNQHLLRMRGKMFRPTLVLLADEATGGPSPHGATLGGGDRADPPGHAGARRRGRSLGAAPRHADDQRAVLAPGLGDHGRLPLLPRRGRAGAARRPAARSRFWRA